MLLGGGKNVLFFGCGFMLRDDVFRGCTLRRDEYLVVC